MKTISNNKYVAMFFLLITIIFLSVTIPSEETTEYNTTNHYTQTYSRSKGHEHQGTRRIE